MSGKKSIQEIAHLSLVWGLRELRELLTREAAQLENVKIVYMKLESFPGVTITRLINSIGSQIRPNASYLRNDPASKKLDDIFTDYDIEPHYQEGIFVACTGKGELNKQLQSNQTAFLAGEKFAQDVNAEQANYAVYIDTDVKNVLASIFPVTQPISDPEVIDLTTKLEQFEAKAPSDRDPKDRFSLIIASTKKFRSVLDNFANIEGKASKDRYMLQIDKFWDSHVLSLERAEQSYLQSHDEKTVALDALRKKLSAVEANKNELLLEMTEREEDHKREIAEKDEKQKDLKNKLQGFVDLKRDLTDTDEARENEEKIVKLQTEIEELKNELEAQHQDFNEAKEASRTSMRDLEDEKDKLAYELEIKTRDLKRLEETHERVRAEASNLQDKLESSNLTPGKVFEGVVASETAAQHTIPLKRRTTFQDKPSLIKPRVSNFENNSVINQAEEDSQAFSMEGIGLLDKSSNTPIRTPVRTTTRPIICKPANFGLNTWNPLTTDIYVHLDKALKAGREALNIGATHTSVTRMILNSLGSNCDHVENFIEGADQMSLEKFAEAIGKILGKKSSVQMQSFLTAQRRSGEDLLAYFTRLQMLYRSSNKLTENSGWEEDPTHSMSFYSKIYDACYQAQKTELIRKTEELLEKGNLTLPKLKGILIDVNKIDISKLSAEEPVVAYVNDKSTYKTEKFAQKNKAWYEDDTSKDNTEKKNDVKRYDNRRKIVCWHCNTPGHTKLQCFKYIRKLREEENKGNQRETKTRGSRQRENNTQHQ